MATGRPCRDHRTTSQGSVSSGNVHRSRTSCLNHVPVVPVVPASHRHGILHGQGAGETRCPPPGGKLTGTGQRLSPDVAANPGKALYPTRQSGIEGGLPTDWIPPPHLRVGNQVNSRASVLAGSHNMRLTKALLVTTTKGALSGEPAHAPRPGFATFFN